MAEHDIVSAVFKSNNSAVNQKRLFNLTSNIPTTTPALGIYAVSPGIS